MRRSPGTLISGEKRCIEQAVPERLLCQRPPAGVTRAKEVAARERIEIFANDAAVVESASLVIEERWHLAKGIVSNNRLVPVDWIRRTFQALNVLGKAKFMRTNQHLSDEWRGRREKDLHRS